MPKFKVYQFQENKLSLYYIFNEYIWVKLIFTNTWKNSKFHLIFFSKYHKYFMVKLNQVL